MTSKVLCQNNVQYANIEREQSYGIRTAAIPDSKIVESTTILFLLLKRYYHLIFCIRSS